MGSVIRDLSCTSIYLSDHFSIFRHGNDPQIVPIP